MSNTFVIDRNGQRFEIEIRISGDKRAVYISYFDTNTNTWTPFEPIDNVLQVADITERDGLTNVDTGIFCYVDDATADPDISTGGALYLRIEPNWIRTYPVTVLNNESFIVPDIPARDNLSPQDGATVVVLDASGDSEIVSGVGVYVKLSSGYTRTFPNQRVYIVADISERDNLPSISFVDSGYIVVVNDATADPEIDSGQGVYLRNETNNGYVKVYPSQSPLTASLGINAQKLADDREIEIQPKQVSGANLSYPNDSFVFSGTYTFFALAVASTEAAVNSGAYMLRLSTGARYSEFATAPYNAYKSLGSDGQWYILIKQSIETLPASDYRWIIIRSPNGDPSTLADGDEIFNNAPTSSDLKPWTITYDTQNIPGEAVVGIGVAVPVTSDFDNGTLDRFAIIANQIILDEFGIAVDYSTNPDLSQDQEKFTTRGVIQNSIPIAGKGINVAQLIAKIIELQLIPNEPDIFITMSSSLADASGVYTLFGSACIDLNTNIFYTFGSPGYPLVNEFASFKFMNNGKWFMFLKRLINPTTPNYNWILIETNKDPSLIQNNELVTILNQRTGLSSVANETENDVQLYGIWTPPDSANSFAGTVLTDNGLLNPFLILTDKGLGADVSLNPDLNQDPDKLTTRGVLATALQLLSAGLGISSTQLANGIIEVLLNDGGLVDSLDVSSSPAQPYEGNYLRVSEGITYTDGATVRLAKLGNPVYDGNATNKYRYYSLLSGGSYFIFSKEYNTTFNEWKWRILHLGTQNPQEIADNGVINIDGSLPSNNWTNDSPTENIAGEGLRNGFTEPPLTSQSSNEVVVYFSGIIANNSRLLLDPEFGLSVDVSMDSNFFLAQQELTDRATIREFVLAAYDGINAITKNANNEFDLLIEEPLTDALNINVVNPNGLFNNGDYVSIREGILLKSGSNYTFVDSSSGGYPSTNTFWMYQRDFAGLQYVLAKVVEGSTSFYLMARTTVAVIDFPVGATINSFLSNIEEQATQFPTFDIVLSFENFTTGFTTHRSIRTTTEDWDFIRTVTQVATQGLLVKGSNGVSVKYSKNSNFAIDQDFATDRGTIRDFVLNNASLPPVDYSSPNNVPGYFLFGKQVTKHILSFTKTTDITKTNVDVGFGKVTANDDFAEQSFFYANNNGQKLTRVKALDSSEVDIIQENISFSRIDATEGKVFYSTSIGGNQYDIKSVDFEGLNPQTIVSAINNTTSLKFDIDRVSKKIYYYNGLGELRVVDYDGSNDMLIGTLSFTDIRQILVSDLYCFYLNDALTEVRRVDLANASNDTSIINSTNIPTIALSRAESFLFGRVNNFITRYDFNGANALQFGLNGDVLDVSDELRFLYFVQPATPFVRRIDYDNITDQTVFNASSGFFVPSMNPYIDKPSLDGIKVVKDGNNLVIKNPQKSNFAGFVDLEYTDL